LYSNVKPNDERGRETNTVKVRHITQRYSRLRQNEPTADGNGNEWNANELIESRGNSHKSGDHNNSNKLRYRKAMGYAAMGRVVTLTCPT